MRRAEAEESCDAAAEAALVLHVLHSANIRGVGASETSNSTWSPCFEQFGRPFPTLAPLQLPQTRSSRLNWLPPPPSSAPQSATPPK